MNVSQLRRLAWSIVFGVARQVGALFFLLLHPFAIAATRGAIPRLPSVSETIYAIRQHHLTLGSAKPARKTT